jgi:hypothetical protein
MLFQGKARGEGVVKRIIKKSNLECPPFLRESTYTILASPIRPDRVQEIEERGYYLHLPMHGSNKGNIPLTDVVRK